jgi:MFS transporter, DHA1 family, multidrug resistance protein
MSQSVRRLLPVLALTVFCANLGAGIIAPLLPVYAKTFGANGFWLGVIFSGSSIASALLMPFAGRLSDKRGRKLILALGLFGSTLASFAYIWAHSIGSLLAVRLIQGAASALISPVSQAYIGDITPPGQEGKWMGLYNATFIIGFGTGPLLGGVVSDHFSMNTAFYIMGFLTLISFLSVLVFLPEIKERKQSIGKFSFRDITRSNITRGVFSFQLGASAIRGVITAFLPVFAVTAALHLNTSLIGTVLTVTIILNSLLQIPSGFVADRFNRKILIIIGGVGMAVQMLLLPLSNGFWLLLFVNVMGSVFDATAGLPAAAAIIQEGRKFGMGATTSVSMMGQGLGMGLAPIIAGLVADATDVRFAFYVCAVITFLCVTGFIVATRKIARI